MEKRYLKLNGVDVLPYISEKGIKWSINDLDGPETGRTLDGMMHRDYVASKIKVEFQCEPSRPTIAEKILKATLGTYITMETNLDPIQGTSTREMYPGARSGVCIHIDEDGVPTWGDISFNLVER